MNALNFAVTNQYWIEQQAMIDILTSFVQAPEFVGWKKLSTEAISLARESSALEPPRYMGLPVYIPFLPSGADRKSCNELVWIAGVLAPEGRGVNSGVGAVEGGEGRLSGAME